VSEVTYSGLQRVVLPSSLLTPIDQDTGMPTYRQATGDEVQHCSAFDYPVSPLQEAPFV
jgi:hypothetical protein